jgi:hypothetical protein
MIHDSDSALFIEHVGQVHEHVGQVHEHVGHDPPTCRKDNRSCRKDHGSHRIDMMDHVSCIMYHVSWFRPTPIQLVVRQLSCERESPEVKSSQVYPVASCSRQVKTLSCVPFLRINRELQNSNSHSRSNFTRGVSE